MQMKDVQMDSALVVAVVEAEERVIESRRGKNLLPSAVRHEGLGKRPSVASPPTVSTVLSHHLHPPPLRQKSL